jgi:hypothetical protein
MRALFSSILLLTSIVLSYSQSVILNYSSSQKVLFLGNSYTAANNLPSLVNQMATSAGDVLTYSSHTPGGETFSGHAFSSTVETLINGNNWDYVTLQGQSQEPAFSTLPLLPHVTTIRDKALANDSASELLLFMTWGRENGDANLFNSGYTQFETYETMDDKLYGSYMYFMENLSSAQMSPVGRVWRYLRANYPALQLYSGDGSHPSIIGSYAAAATFYTMIFKKDPTQISFESSLSSSDAAIIKDAVKLIVFDEMPTWMNGSLDFSIANGPRIIVATPLIDSVGTFNWSFGDGSSSTEFSPSHEYQFAGPYTITMERFFSDDTITISKEVIVTDTAIQGVSGFYPYILTKPSSGDTTFNVDNTNGSQYYRYTAQKDEIINFSSLCTTNLNTWLHVYRNSFDQDSLVYSVDDDRFYQNEFSSPMKAGETFIFCWDDTHDRNDFPLLFDTRFSVTDFVDLTNPDSTQSIVEGQNFIYNIDQNQYLTFTAPSDGSLLISTCEYFTGDSLPISLINSETNELLAIEQFCLGSNYYSNTFLEYDGLIGGTEYIVELGVPFRYECQSRDAFDFAFTAEATGFTTVVRDSSTQGRAGEVTLVTDNSPTGTMDTIITTTVVDTVTDSLWNITDHYDADVLQSSDPAVYISRNIWVDTISASVQTKKYGTTLSTIVRDSTTQKKAPETVVTTVLTGELNKEDTVITTTGVDTVTDSLWSITDHYDADVLQSSDPAVYISRNIWVDTISTSVQTKKYCTTLSTIVRDSTIQKKVPETVVITAYVGELNKEDTLITTTVVDTVTDSLWSITDHYDADVFQSSDLAAFISVTIWVDTISSTAETKKWGNTAITFTEQSTIPITTLAIYPNPVDRNSDGVSLAIPSDLSGNWQITVYDALGNLMDESSFRANGGSIYKWDLHSRNGNRVAGGTYVLIAKLTDGSGRSQMFKRMIGVRE